MFGYISVGNEVVDVIFGLDDFIDSFGDVFFWSDIVVEVFEVVVVGFLNGGEVVCRIEEVERVDGFGIVGKVDFSNVEVNVMVCVGDSNDFVF